jgi:hypothetical protein
VVAPNPATETVLSPKALPARGAPCTPAGGMFRNGSSPAKLARFKARVLGMLEQGSTWTYYPAEDRFEELVTVQPAKHSATGKPRMIAGLTVYGRVVYEAPEWLWRLFLEAHPGAIGVLSAEFHKPSEALIDMDAYAVHREGNIR